MLKIALMLQLSTKMYSRHGILGCFFLVRVRVWGLSDVRYSITSIPGWHPEQEQSLLMRLLLGSPFHNLYTCIT